MCVNCGMEEAARTVLEMAEKQGLSGAMLLDVDEKSADDERRYFSQSEPHVVTFGADRQYSTVAREAVAKTWGSKFDMGFSSVGASRMYGCMLIHTFAPDARLYICIHINGDENEPQAVAMRYQALGTVLKAVEKERIAEAGGESPARQFARGLAEALMAAATRRNGYKDEQKPVEPEVPTTPAFVVGQTYTVEDDTYAWLYQIDAESGEISADEFDIYPVADGGPVLTCCEAPGNLKLEDGDGEKPFAFFTAGGNTYALYEDEVDCIVQYAPTPESAVEETTAGDAVS